MAPRKQKPPISEWIVRERKRLTWKPKDVSDRLKAAGYEAEESTVQVWEAGRSPKAETIDALEKLFGSVAPRENGNGNADLSAMIAAQTAAIERQTAVLERVLELLQGQAGSRLGQLVSALAEIEPAIDGSDQGAEGHQQDADGEGAVPSRRSR
jgi:hypothetical protein